MELVPLNNPWIALSRPTDALRVPDGDTITLPMGTEVMIAQELGGDFTVRGRAGALFRIDGINADALGRAPQANLLAPTFGSIDEGVIDSVLRSCYDPEIPVNIVDMGLIYESIVQEIPEAPGQHRVRIKMTLTAPGCGMAQVMVNDVEAKLKRIAGIDEVHIELVFDPPWNPSMMTEAAKLQAGIF